MNKSRKINRELDQLMLLIKKLRSPDGCPWDRKQKRKDIGKYILEETYEVIDSLEKKNAKELEEELGDLLFQILFLAEMGAEKGDFSLSGILSEVRKKMIRRHPHIFGNLKVNSAEEVKVNWQQIKKREQAQKAVGGSLFTGIPRSLPALKRAQKITAAASVYGFDWQKSTEVLKKLHEELKEFKIALKSNVSDKIEEELGDLLLTTVNLSRFAQVDSETALSKSTNKFLRRFAYITARLAANGKTLEEATLAEMDGLWEEAKKIGV